MTLPGPNDSTPLMWLDTGEREIPWEGPELQKGDVVSWDEDGKIYTGRVSQRRFHGVRTGRGRNPILARQLKFLVGGEWSSV